MLTVALCAAISLPGPVAAATSAAGAERRPDEALDYRIHLKHRTVGPKASVDHALLAETKQGGGNRHAIVQLHNLPRAQHDDLGALGDLGVDVLGYLGGVDGLSTAYIASISPGVRTDAQGWGQLVRSVVRIKASDKVDPLVGAPGTPPDLLIQFYSDVAADDARAALERVGVDASRYAANIWRGAATAAQVTRLSGEDAVEWIQPTQKHQILLDGTRSVGNVDPVQQLDIDSAQYLGLSGAGVQIGIMDTGVDNEHDDFDNRIVRPQDDGGDHGTHVAGIAAGSGVRSNQNNDGNMSNGMTAFRFRGVAPQAGIAAYGQIGGNAGLFADAINNFGMDVSNHSYVLQDQSRYDAGVAAVDQIARGDSPGVPARTVVWAAANNGDYDHNCPADDPTTPNAPRPQYPGGCPTGFQTGYFSMLSPCKNCIDVGAIDKSQAYAGFSSLGPNMDGRLGPIVSAVGVGVTSVGANTDRDGNAVTGNGYRGKGGTSMAAPAVAGMVALMRQQYELSGDGVNGPLPSTDKAILIQTATDQVGSSGNNNPDTGAPTAFGAGPDWATGFGIANVQAAVNLIRARNFVEDDVAAANPTDTFPVSVVPGQPQLKVSLAWDDIAGTPAADDTAAKLVNDLDLTLIDPNGVVHRPLVLPILTPRDCDGATAGTQVGTCAGDQDSAANTGNNYAAVAAQGTDRRNVVEQVVVPNPTAGQWRARVSVLNTDTSVRLPMGGTQNYSLAGVTDARANLRVTKSAAPDPGTAGEQLFYTVRVTNDGPDTARQATVVDVLPEGVAYVTSDLPGGCVQSPTRTLTCAVGDIASGASKAFKIKVFVAPDLVSDNGEPLSIFNTASVASTTPDDDAADNTATIGTIIEDRADLSVTKMCKPDGPLSARDTGHCTIFIDNAGPSFARSVTLTETMLSDGAFTVSNVSASQGSCGAVAPVNGGQKFSCSLGTLANATPSNTGRATVSYDVNATEAVDINSFAKVVSFTPDPDTDNNSAAGTLNVTAVADLSIQKIGPASVIAGENATFTISIRNDGVSKASAVKVTDNVPAGTEIVSVTASDGASCNAGVPGNAGLPTVCSFGTLNAGENRTMTVTLHVLPTTLGQLNNDVRVSSDTFDDDMSDNLDTVPTIVTGSADMSVIKLDSPDPVTAGNQLTYTVTTANNGPSTARNVTITDTLPNGTTFVNGVDGNGQTACALVQSGTVVCDVGDLDPGETATAYITVKVAPSVPPGTVSNTVTVGSTTLDPNPANNSAAEVTQVITSAELWLDKLATQRSGNPSPVVTYTLQVHNDRGCESDAQSTQSPNCGAGGPSDAQNVTVVDTLPLDPKKLVVQYVSPQCTYTRATHTVTCSTLTIPAGAVASFVIEAQVSGSVGTILNTARLSSATDDPVSANNTNAASLVMKGGTGKR